MARTLKKIGLYLFLGFYLLISLYPLLWMLLNSFKNNEEIFVTNPFGLPGSVNLENYHNALSLFNLPLYFRNSMIVCIGAVMITIGCAILFAYATARMRFRFAGRLQAFITIGMFIPVQIIIIPLVILVRDFHLQSSLLSLIIPYAAFQLPFSCLILYGFFRSIPYELEEAAYMDGAGVFRTLFQVILPLVKPAIATLVIFNFLSYYNEYYVANILISNDALRTLPLGLMYFKGQFGTDWGGSAAMMVLASLPVLIIYLFFSDKVEKAMTVDAAIKG